MPTPPDPTAAATPSFAARLRSATAAEHAAAEGSELAARLVGGDIDVGAYAVFAVQLRAVYGALEEAARGVADDPVVGPLMDRSLERADVLDADIAWLVEHADEAVPTSLLPATLDYVARVREVAGWPGGVVAHHYTRYLGDLSGGIVIGRALARALGGGVGFYRFPETLDARAFKLAYRAHLDQAPWSADEQARITTEVVTAYRCNGRLLREVDERTRTTGGTSRATGGTPLTAEVSA